MAVFDLKNAPRSHRLSFCTEALRHAGLEERLSEKNKGQHGAMLQYQPQDFCMMRSIGHGCSVAFPPSDLTISIPNLAAFHCNNIQLQSPEFCFWPHTPSTHRAHQDQN